MSSFEALADSSFEWPQIETCRRLCSELAAFCIVKRALRAAFVSIKGIYYQVELNGERVLWVTPHNFSHQVCTCTCTLALFHCPPLLLSITLFLYSTLLSRPSFLNVRMCECASDHYGYLRLVHSASSILRSRNSHTTSTTAS